MERSTRLWLWAPHTIFWFIIYFNVSTSVCIGMMMVVICSLAIWIYSTMWRIINTAFRKHLSSLSPCLLVKSLLPAFIFPMMPSLHGAVQFLLTTKLKKVPKFFSICLIRALIKPCFKWARFFGSMCETWQHYKIPLTRHWNFYSNISCLGRSHVWPFK